MDPSARLFLCAACRCQVVVCRACDRGQSYCGRACAEEVRRARQREARRRYAASRRGRLANAARQAAFRARTRSRSAPEVTDQGSEPVAAPATSAASTSSAAIGRTTTAQGASVVATDDEGAVRCRFCRRPCSALLRRAFLRPEARGARHRRARRGADPDP